MKKKKYALFIGRWQNWHAGHRWLIDQALNKGEDVLLAIRDVDVDENNPKPVTDVFDELLHELRDLVYEKRVRLLIIPDITSVNYGRGVGYDVIYHEPPTEVAAISGTAIRDGQMDNQGNSITN